MLKIFCKYGESCFIGLKTNTVCHKLEHTRKDGFKDFSQLTDTEVKPITLRANVTDEADTNDQKICLHCHYAHLVTWYNSVSKNMQ